MDAAGPAEYLVGHLEEALARDPRVTEQGLHVTVECEPLVVTVTGTVVAAQHKAGLASVIAEMLPEAELHDETTIVDASEGPSVERVT